MSNKIEIISTNKFKHVDISFKFVKRYIRNKALDDYAICKIIGEYSNIYKTKYAMSSIKDKLYGINVYAYQDINGDNTTLHFTYHFLDPKYGNDLNEVLAFIYETLFNPYIDEKIVDEIKYNYASKIMRNLDNPSRFANNQLIKIIGKDNHIANRDIDLRYLLDDLSVKSISDAYHDLISNSDLYIYVIGNVKKEDYININSWFKDKKREYDYEYNKLYLKDMNYIIESKALSQSYLRVVYNTDYSNIDDSYYKWMVADALFGSSSSSLLFKEVREKHSLCYSISSSLLKSEGLVIVASAISYENVEDVTMLIDECILKLVNKTYDFNELNLTKKMLVNSLKSNNDDAKNCIDFIHSNNILKRNYSIDEIINFINNVTVDDVSEVMKSYKKCLTYVLKEECDASN